MGQIVGAFATSHSPGITGFPERADPRQVETIYTAFKRVKKQLDEARPDAVVGISVEHFTNFFLSNLPALCIGIADSYVGPPNEQFVSFFRVDQRTFPGHPALGRALLEEALQVGFDPASAAGDFAFDENFSVPFKFLMPDDLVPVVPIIVNGVQPPFPLLRRCYEFGTMLRRAIEKQTVAERVALIATGGLSHWVGAPESGQIDEEWDRRVLSLLERGESAQITAWTDEQVDVAGNGAHEIRTWLILAGAMPKQSFQVLAYEPIPAWLTGTAVASVPLSNTPQAVEQRGRQ